MASRALTAGEVAMASALFGGAIDYAKVRIHNRRYFPFQPKNCAMSVIAMEALLFGGSIHYELVRIYARRYVPFQPKNCCITPNGSMYFHRLCFLPDYTRGDPSVVHWLLHSMAHVWQHQLGYAVRLRGSVHIDLHDLSPGKTLADFNMEANGDVLADYFAFEHLRSSGSIRQRRLRKQLASV